MNVCTNCSNSCKSSLFNNDLFNDDFQWIRKTICRLYNPIGFNDQLIEYYEFLENS